MTTTLYDTSNTNGASKKVGRFMGMIPLSSHDVKTFCINNKLAHECGAGTRFDEDSYACVPKKSVCPDGYTIDRKIGRCVHKEGDAPALQTAVCGEGTVFDERNNSCRVNCEPGTHWNDRVRQCERPCEGDNIEHIVCGPRDQDVISCEYK